MKVSRDYIEGKKSPWRCRWRVPGDKMHKTKHFRTEEEQEAYAQELEARYSEAVCVTLSARDSVVWKRLEMKAAEMQCSVEALLEPVLMVSRRSVHYDGVELSVAFAAYQKYGLNTKGWSDKQQKNVKYALGRWKKYLLQRYARVGSQFHRSRELGDGVRMEPTLVQAVREPQEIVDYLKWEFPGKSSWLQNRSVIAACWRWCAAKGWCDESFVRDIKWEGARVLKKRKPWWPAQRVGDFVKAMCPELRAHWWLRFQAGIRADEVRRMKWEEVTDDGFYGVDFKAKEIHMNPEWTKMGKYRRLYDLGDEFWVELKKLRKDVKGEWVTPREYVIEKSQEYDKKYSRRKAAALKEIGVQVMAQNLARHTFAAQGYHHGLEWVIDVLGHEEGLSVFNTHYKGNLTDVEAKRLRKLRLDFRKKVER